MLIHALATAFILAQTLSPPPSGEERAAAAAVRAADAADRAALTAERVAALVEPGLRPEPPPPPPAPGWTGNVGLSFGFITGNAVNLSLIGNLALDRVWEDWALGLRVTGAYGFANPEPTVPGSSVAVTALRAAGTLRGDRTFGSGFASIYLLGGEEADHIKNIESRSFGELGTGLSFLNFREAGQERLLLKLDLGIRGGYETRYQYYPFPARVPIQGIPILSPRAALTFRLGFGRYARFSEELEVMPSLLAPTAGRVLLNNTAKVNANLTGALSLAVALLVSYDSSPPQTASGPQRLPTDVALTAGLELTL
jgi:hypothetical protein